MPSVIKMMRVHGSGDISRNCHSWSRSTVRTSIWDQRECCLTDHRILADGRKRWIAFASQPLNGLPGASAKLISKEWLKSNIQIGPLGSEYPDVMYGMEGDTPSYLGLIPVSRALLLFWPQIRPTADIEEWAERSRTTRFWRVGRTI
jgi:hypothetical protein